MKTHTNRKLLVPIMVLVLLLSACNCLQARDFVVVIDPGHGGKDVGCVGNYSYEKDIVLAVGKMLGDKIKKNSDNVQVIYTRDTDRFIPLQDRADIANRNHADLFISVHVNSVAAKAKNRNTVQGVSVYTLGAERTAANLEVAKRENSVIILEEDYSSKYGGYDPNNPESDIMMGLLQNRYINESIDFATMAQKQLVTTAGRADHDVKQAGFLVLRNVSAPAVLVELDFICNPTQEKFLSSKAGQEKMANALYNAFNSYLAAKMRQAQIGIEEPQVSQPTEPDKGNKDTDKPDKNKDKKSKDKDKKDKDKKDKDKDKKDKDKDKTKPQETTPVAEQKPQNQTPSQQPAQQTNPQPEQRHSQQQQPQPQQQQPAQQTKPQPEQSQDQKKPDEQPQKVQSPTEHVQSTFNPQKTTPAQQQDAAQPGQILYKVQILTSGKLLKAGDPAFKGLTDVDYYQDGVYKYTVGCTPNKAEADKLLRSVQTKFPQAFIIQWKDGRRIK